MSAQTPASDPLRLRILLIDDEPDIRTVLKIALGTEHEIAEAESGMAGLAMLGTFEPDFVICDIMMPIMSGMETVEAIRKHPRFFDIPVFFLSAERHKELPELTMEAGGNLFLEKPIEPRRLLQLIDLFAQEMGITPRPHRSPEPATSEPAAAQTAPPTVRILTIDPNPATLSRLKQILDSAPGGRWEAIWSDDAGESLANLDRLQPDLILYNPRQKMAGIAFIQNLHLRQMLNDCKICFAGVDVSPTEMEYNLRLFGRGPILLDRPEEAVLRDLAEAIRIAQTKQKARPKRLSLEELRAQDQKRIEQLRAARSPERTEQYQRFQNRIDRSSL